MREHRLQRFEQQLVKLEESPAVRDWQHGIRWHLHPGAYRVEQVRKLSGRLPEESAGGLIAGAGGLGHALRQPVNCAAREGSFEVSDSKISAGCDYFDVNMFTSRMG